MEKCDMFFGMLGNSDNRSVFTLVHFTNTLCKIFHVFGNLKNYFTSGQFSKNGEISTIFSTRDDVRCFFVSKMAITTRK